MARNSSPKTSTKAKASAEAPTTENEETVAVSAPTEAVEATEQENVEAAEAAGTDTEDIVDFEEVKTLGEAFVAAIERFKDDPAATDQSQEAIQERRTAAASDEAEAVQKAYNDLNTKSKAAARAWANAEMQSNMTPATFERAVGFHDLHKVLKSNSSKSGGTATKREPVNPTEAFVAQVTTIRLAHSILSESAPENVDEGWRDSVKAKAAELGEQVTAYRAWLDSDGESSDEPEVDAIVAQAFKIATSRAKKAAKGATGTRTVSYTGEPRSVDKHIAEVFEGKPVGTFMKVSEIRNTSTSEYGSDLPSPGAISSKINSPRFSIPGLTPTKVDGKAGLRKDGPSNSES